MARIGLGQAAALRPGIADASRYTVPQASHLGALWLAAAAPALGILILLGVR